MWVHNTKQNICKCYTNFLSVLMCVHVVIWDIKTFYERRTPVSMGENIMEEPQSHGWPGSALHKLKSVLAKQRIIERFFFIRWNLLSFFMGLHSCRIKLLFWMANSLGNQGKSMDIVSRGKKRVKHVYTQCMHTHICANFSYSFLHFSVIFS